MCKQAALSSKIVAKKTPIRITAASVLGQSGTLLNTVRVGRRSVFLVIMVILSMPCAPNPESFKFQAVLREDETLYCATYWR